MSHPITIAFLGPQGTFTEQALQDFTREWDDVRALPVGSPTAAIDMVRAGTADYACVALESAVDGPVTQTEDALVSGSNVQIYGERVIPVTFSIMVAPGTRAEDVRSISAHPVAHAQIRSWLADHMPHATFIPASSNGAAAADVANHKVDAAAAPTRAAELHGLEQLAAGVADVDGAFTRFVLVGKPDTPIPRTGSDRTSIVITLRNRPASLQEALMELSIRNVDMSRISSRPLRSDSGTIMGVYAFHIDIVGHIEDPAVAEALAALYRRADTVRYLGSWPVAAPGEVIHAGSAPPLIDESAQWVAALKKGGQS